MSAALTLLALLLALALPDVAVEDLGRFPSLDASEASYSLNRERRAALADDFAGRGFSHQRAEGAPWLAWYDECGAAWLALSAARLALAGVSEDGYQDECDVSADARARRADDCRDVLRLLRRRVGPLAYYRGEMPPAALPAFGRE